MTMLTTLRRVRSRVRRPVAPGTGRHATGRVRFTTGSGLPGYVVVTREGGTVWLVDQDGDHDRYAGQVTATAQGYSATACPDRHRDTWQEAARDAAEAALAHRADDPGPGYRDAYRIKIELVRAAGHPAMTSAWTRRDDAESVALRLADEVYRTGLLLAAARRAPESTIGYVQELRARFVRAERALVHAAHYAAGQPAPADVEIPAQREGSCVLGCGLI